MDKKHIVYKVVRLVAFGAIAGGLISCGTSSAEQNLKQITPAETTPATSTKANTTTQSDRQFIEMMIPHHQGAVEMADMAFQKAKRPEIKKLAEAIKKDQNKEIQQMQTWYKQWYGKDISASSGSGMGMDHSMHQQDSMSMEMMGMDMQALKNAADFDREFIKQMIPHHQSAVTMAEKVVDSADKPEIRNLAKLIIDSQIAEIKQMQQWQQAWYK
jgi:uncharacterized protein (DUF305 family)